MYLGLMVLGLLGLVDFSGTTSTVKCNYCYRGARLSVLRRRKTSGQAALRVMTVSQRGVPQRKNLQVKSCK